MTQKFRLGMRVILLGHPGLTWYNKRGIVSPAPNEQNTISGYVWVKFDNPPYEGSQGKLFQVFADVLSICNENAGDRNRRLLERRTENDKG